jgi:hypothetical protein
VPEVYVDASVFTKDSAFGRVSGRINVAVIPQIGDLMAFEPRGPASAYAQVDPLRVTHRIISASGEDDVSLSLDDITVETDADARNVMRFLEGAYDLICEIWGEDD